MATRPEETKKLKMPQKLPKGWVKTTLGEVCAMNPRTPFDESVSDHTEVSFVPMAAVEEESGRLDASQVRALGSVRKGYTPFRENDVIFAKITPCMENGKIAQATGLKNGLAYGSTEFFVFRPHEGVLPRFILYFLLQPKFREDAERQMTGASGQRRVPSNYLFTHEFWLPPTHEQKRIVSKLDAALLRLERAELAARRAQKRLKLYRAAVLQAAITGELSREWRRTHKHKETGTQLLQRLLEVRRVVWEESELRRFRVAGKSPKDSWKSRYSEPAPPMLDLFHTIPQGWVYATLDQLLLHITDGDHQPPPQVDSGIPLLVIGNLRNGHLDFTDTRFVARHYVDGISEMRKPKKGDILYSLVGSFGISVLVDTEVEFCIQRHIAVLRPHKLSPTSYLSKVLNSDFIFLQAEKSATGTAQRTVGLASLRRFSIPLPPVEEQAHIVCEVEKRLIAADRFAATLNRQLDRTQATRQSLLREAFEGHLVPQRPDDEPASILLERIRIARDNKLQKPKGNHMSRSKLKATRRPLLDVLREHKKPMTPEMLFRDSGFEAMFKASEEPQDMVDAFYKELRKLTDKPAKVSEQKDSRHEVMLKVLP